MAQENQEEIPFLAGLGFFVTYQCQVACSHCIVKAGPLRTERLSLEAAFGLIEQIAGYRAGYISALALTGGEPLFDLEHIRHISNYAHSKGLVVSVVTNAFWAATPDRAVQVLESLPAIRLIAISTDSFHLEHIPMDRVRNAAVAARSLGRRVSVAVCRTGDEDPGYRAILEQLLGFMEEKDINTTVFFPVGRALEELGRPGVETAGAPPEAACPAAYSPVLFPDGKVVACIGPVIELKHDHPLMLGNFNEAPLEKILDDAQANPVLHAIRVWGPSRLIEELEKAGLERFLPSTYVKESICRACYDLMANPDAVAFLARLAENEDFSDEVAYARAYYLKEPQMAQLRGLC